MRLQIGRFGLYAASTVLLCLGMGLGSLPARSQVRMTPNILEIEAKRGQSQGYFTISNPGETPFRARISAIPFTYDRANGFQGLPESHPQDLTPYLQFTPRELEVQPGTSRRVRLIGRLAPSLPEGEYRSALIVENLQPVITTDGRGNQVQIVQQTAIVVFVRKGDFQPNLTVEQAIWDAEARNITLLVQNRGGASTRPEIQWRLVQENTTVDEGTITPTIVIAESDRNFVITYAEGEETPPPGDYQLQGEMIWHEDNYRQKRGATFNINLIVD
ncbi:hypothetical protein [Spirulina sp. 06S082]|uniref:fimbrial biogenesis chaperone n=1 Tax=Spirulina sp. 06S082 TaxID=3110248 RepID=UPI002B2033E5|nr:hypothetical protein [Spirulina sp. 06S082]MEA5468353.1 hypothetical protein [Spirulina sp. 06S082]